MKYRKKPIVVEAEQFWPDQKPWPEGVDEEPATHGNRWRIETLEGPFRVIPGDWIITGIAGERYPCKPDIFDATYTPVVGCEIDRLATRVANDAYTAAATVAREHEAKWTSVMASYKKNHGSAVAIQQVWLAADVCAGIARAIERLKEN